MLTQGIHTFSAATQLALVPLLWLAVPAVYMALSRRSLCAPAKAWWAISLPVYLAWLAFNNPIAADAVRSFS